MLVRDLLGVWLDTVHAKESCAAALARFDEGWRGAFWNAWAAFLQNSNPLRCPDTLLSMFCLLRFVIAYCRSFVFAYLSLLLSSFSFCPSVSLDIFFLRNYGAQQYLFTWQHHIHPHLPALLVFTHTFHIHPVPSSSSPPPFFSFLFLSHKVSCWREFRPSLAFTCTKALLANIYTST
ncbi:hypothetical protein BC936DRAFT_140339 [Jimgerdemannia flammicorona]|uniref:Uncharacterized protein n=1 Tax=Jimgerdemannia flammicorona TaxID=994334 RepID=A0A433DGW4_9FUNG|nr:hypothetical protein BC936DRAFT_140339 [Jimgerdemannia flammicorona]